MMKNFHKYWLVGLLVIIAVSMGVTKIRYRNVDWEKIYPPITPTATPTSVPQINVDYPLWELLPYTGTDFVVDRYTEPGVLAIKTKMLNKKIITQEVYEWLLENKVATESHKLVFEKE
jgi:hypothetical protein